MNKIWNPAQEAGDAGHSASEAHLASAGVHNSPQGDEPGRGGCETLSSVAGLDTSPNGDAAGQRNAETLFRVAGSDNSAREGGDGDHPSSANGPVAIDPSPDEGASPASRCAKPIRLPPGSTLSEKSPAKVASKPRKRTPGSPPSAQAEDGGHSFSEAHLSDAAVQPSPKGAPRRRASAAAHEDHAAGQSSGAASAGVDGPDKSRDPDASRSSTAKSPKGATKKVGPGQKYDGAQQGAAEPDLRFADPLVREIVQMHRQRRRWIKARNALILQAKATGRALVEGGDKAKGSSLYNRAMACAFDEGERHMEWAFLPFRSAISAFDAEIKPLERHLEKLAKRLPIAPFIAGVRGVGLGSLAAIVGEAGDLSAYRTVSGVWKRLGLAVIDGERQRKCVDAEKALAHGYAPERRSIMWNVGNGLIGGMGHGKRPLVGEDISLREDWSEYERMFVERLRIEAARDPDDMRDPVDGKESYSQRAAARAKRYVEKQFLLRLTVEWRRVSGAAIATQEPVPTPPPADATNEREAVKVTETNEPAPSAHMDAAA